MKIGAKKDGALTAIQESSIANVGNANGKANCDPQHFNWHTSNLYECANVNLEQFTVLTNYQTTGPMRAPLNMPAIFCLETHIDMLADARQQLFKLAVPDFSVKETEFESRDGLIYTKSNQKKTVSFTSACKNIDPVRYS